MKFDLHRPSAWDSSLPPLGECHHEANLREAAKWGRSATPWAHWPVTFAHCFLVLGTPRGDTYFGGIPNFLIIS
jgi:hypothetical protein